MLNDDLVIERLLAGERFTLDEYVCGRAIAGTPQMCVGEIERWQQAVRLDEY